MAGKTTDTTQTQQKQTKSNIPWVAIGLGVLAVGAIVAADTADDIGDALVGE